MTIGSQLKMLVSKYKTRWLLIALIILSGSTEIKAQKTEIKIEGIRSDIGQIIINVYKDQDSFKKEQPSQKEIYNKSKIIDGVMRVSITLDEGQGIYGFALIDDENRNGEMDYRKTGFAIEGFAFSNFYLNGFKRPTFDDFKFIVEKDLVPTIVMKIRYM